MLKLKTYCWNHCSKIIFKCVNSAVGPIFNENIDKKWNLWVREQCTDVLFTENWSKVAATVYVPYMNNSREWGENAWKKKKKKKRRNWNAANANPNTHWFKFETYLTNCTVHIHTRNHFSIMNESFQTNPSMMTMKHFNEFIFHNVNKHYLLII